MFFLLLGWIYIFWQDATCANLDHHQFSRTRLGVGARQNHNVSIHRHIALQPTRNEVELELEEKPANSSDKGRCGTALFPIAPSTQTSATFA